MPKEYTYDNFQFELDHVKGLLVAMEEDREMFGFVEEDQKKYENLILKKAELEKALQTLTLE